MRSLNVRRRAAFNARSGPAKARNTIRRFIGRIGRLNHSTSSGFLFKRTGKFSMRHRPYFRRGRRPGFAKGGTRITRQTVTTAMYNPLAADNYAHWINGEPGATATLMPVGWNLWSNTSNIYVGAGGNVLMPTETGGSSTGSAGEIVQGRFRVAMADPIGSTDFQQWEYVKLNFVVLYFQYQCTDYTAGNDANGLVPTLQYSFDTDGTFSGASPYQLTPTQLQARSNAKTLKLPRGKIQSITIYPTMFSMMSSDTLGGTSYVSKRVSPGFVDPRSSAWFAPVSNIQWQLRNFQLPGGTDATGQTSMVKVWAKYHYTLSNFIGANTT